MISGIDQVRYELMTKKIEIDPSRRFSTCGTAQLLGVKVPRLGPSRSLESRDGIEGVIVGWYLCPRLVRPLLAERPMLHTSASQ